MHVGARVWDDKGVSKTVTATASDLFDGGPLRTVQRQLHLVERRHPHNVRRAALATVVAWVPIAVLTLVDGRFIVHGHAGEFATDIGAHARFLVAVPLLILAEALWVPRISAIVRHFVEYGFIPDAERMRFDAAVASTVEWRDSVAAGVALVLLTYAIVIALARLVPESDVAFWIEGVGPGTLYSPAGWWHVLVSVPLLICLILGWVWRFALWTLLLLRLSHLDLNLLASHPDHAAGLMFVGYSVRAGTLFGTALGAIIAGFVANHALHDGMPLAAFKYHIGALVLVVLFLVAGPTTVFAGRLLAVWRRGVFEYGALADHVGLEFERRWFARSILPGASPLEVPDFSATTDLYSIVGNVYAMQFAPVDWRSLFLLALATLLPFVPVVFAVAPLDEILKVLAGLVH